MEKHKPVKRALVIGVVMFLLSACNEETVYSKLSEREANEMIALLVSSGIGARKGADKDGKFKVLTESQNFATAVNVLSVNGFPRETYNTLGDVFSKESFVSSPLEERARLNFALSQEIANTLSSIDGVLLARVHLAVPPRDDLSNSVPPASASVFIKHRSDVDLSGNTSMIKNLVVDGIENLAYEDVTVAFFKSGYGSSPSVEPATLLNAAADTRQVDAQSTLSGLRLSLIPSISPTVLVASALGFGLLLVLGSFWRRKPSVANHDTVNPNQINQDPAGKIDQP